MRVLILSILLPLSACATAQAPGAASPMMARDPLPGDHVPSPAMVKCSMLGGTSEFRAGVTGRVGLCRLGRAAIDEWTLFWAAENHEFGAAAQAFREHRPVAATEGDGNPAPRYCAAMGGTSVVLQDPAGHQVLGCLFDDDSVIEQWTLLRGPADVANRQLAALLR